MNPQIGMTIHYIPLDIEGKPAEPKPAMVMGVSEVPGGPPNLHLAIFEGHGSETRMSYSRRVPPASTTVTGSGWAWPEWLMPSPIYASLSDAEVRELVDNMRPKTVFRRPGGPKPGGAELSAFVDQAAEALAETHPKDDRLRDMQKGEVILLALGSILLAGIVTSLIAAALQAQ